MMTPALRRFTFTTHITSSVGWVGAALVFLALAVIGFTSDDPVKVRGAHLLMAPAAWFVLVPLAHASLLSGIAFVAGHNVGVVSVLLGRLEAGHNGLRDRDSADLHGNVPGDGGSRGGSSRGSGGRAKRVADRSRNPGPGPLACCNSPGRLQAVCNDRLWEAEVRRAAAGGVFDRPGQCEEGA
jgi:hypothetical protein